MTASAMPPSRTAGGGGGNGAQDFGCFADIFENIFGEFMGGAQQGAGAATSARGSDLRYDLEISLEDAFHGKPGRAPGRRRRALRALRRLGRQARHLGAQPATTCGGRGQVRAQQGFFVVERTCPTCRGVGEVIADPCHACRGEGRVEKQQVADGQHSRRRRRGHPHPPRRRGRGRRARRPAGRPLHLRPPRPARRSSSARARRCSRAARSASPPRRSAAAIEVPGLDSEAHEIRIPAGIQSGKQLRQRGAGMPVLNGRGHGDMVIQIEVETPPSSARSSGSCSRNSATPRPARNARKAAASSRS